MISQSFYSFCDLPGEAVLQQEAEVRGQRSGFRGQKKDDCRKVSRRSRRLTQRSFTQISLISADKYHADQPAGWQFSAEIYQDNRLFNEHTASRISNKSDNVILRRSGGGSKND